jgi:uncharacterized protein
MATPFHPGELALQTKIGVKEKVARFGERGIRAFMPEEHREFFEELPCVFIASLDASGRPWASMVWGVPGFVTSPDPTTLRIAGTLAQADPLARNLAPGAVVGVLGIQLETRRRNRANGVVIAHEDNVFSVHVAQSFGNCQKYIQIRKPKFGRDPRAQHETPVFREGALLSDEARRIVSASDTCFIASRSRLPALQTHGEGVDVSHRGGLPGFLRLSDGKARSSISMPDYIGNFLFNTLGNIQADPRVGLLFVDFARGALLTLVGEAEIIWDGPEVRALPGAQRLVRIAVSDGLRMPDTLPFTWSEPVFAPQLEDEQLG